MPNGIVVNLTSDGRTAIANSMAVGDAITVSSIKFYAGTPTVINDNIDPSTDPTLDTLIAEDSGTVSVAATNNLMQLGSIIELVSGISSTTAQTMLIGFNKNGTDDGVLAYSTFAATSLNSSMNFVAAIGIENMALSQVTFANAPFANVPCADDDVVGGISFSPSLLIQNGLLENTDNGKPIVLRPSQVQEFVQGNYWYGSITLVSGNISDYSAIKSKNIAISGEKKITFLTALSGSTVSLVEGKYLPLNSTSAEVPSEFMLLRDSSMVNLPIPTDGSYNLLIKEKVL